MPHRGKTTRSSAVERSPYKGVAGRFKSSRVDQHFSGTYEIIAEHRFPERPAWEWHLWDREELELWVSSTQGPAWKFAGHPVDRRNAIDMVLDQLAGLRVELKVSSADYQVVNDSIGAPLSLAPFPRRPGS